MKTSKLWIISSIVAVAGVSACSSHKHMDDPSVHTSAMDARSDRAQYPSDRTPSYLNRNEARDGLTRTTTTTIDDANNDSTFSRGYGQSGTTADSAVEQYNTNDSQTNRANRIENTRARSKADLGNNSSGMGK
ncbi:MAG: hypothetical protein H7333_02655 [Bdellovibrionales bacterium]|nr:hypothetical protein [Oligoflexia bacterium]